MLTVLTSKCSGGKDTLMSKLIEEAYEKMISTSTRPMRPGEVEGREYFFTDTADFKKKIKDGYFLEYREYHTTVNGVPDVWYYGLGKQVSKDEITDKDYVTIKDPKGAMECINYYGRENCFVVYIELDDKTREERASKRGGFDKIEWDRRLADDTIRFSDEIFNGIVNTRIQNTGTVEELKDNFLKAYEEYKAKDDVELGL